MIKKMPAYVEVGKQCVRLTSSLAPQAPLWSGAVQQNAACRGPGERLHSEAAGALLKGLLFRDSWVRQL